WIAGLFLYYFQFKERQMNQLKDNRSKVLLIISIYVVIVFILSLIQVQRLNLNHFIYFGFFILTVYNLEAILKLFNSNRRREVILWIVLLYIVQLLGTAASFSVIQTYYVQIHINLSHDVQQAIVIEQQVAIFKNLIKLVLIWSRSMVLFGFAKRYLDEKQ